MTKRKVKPDDRWRVQALWEKVRHMTVGEIVVYADAVKAGADPIEAMNGHLCGPKCLHWSAMSKEQQAKLRKAPWNQ